MKRERERERERKIDSKKGSRLEGGREIKKREQAKKTQLKQG